jgi:hypothetical protein
MPADPVSFLRRFSSRLQPLDHAFLRDRLRNDHGSGRKFPNGAVRNRDFLAVGAASDFPYNRLGQRDGLLPQEVELLLGPLDALG